MKLKNLLDKDCRRSPVAKGLGRGISKLAFVVLFLFVQNDIFAQLLCDTEPATTGINTSTPNRMLDAIIIGVAIMIVLFTLFMSIKYLFKPGENNPNHIKNIVKDEGF